MKKQGHPDYQDTLFVDTATGTKFVCGSTLKPKETEEFEGKKYPVFRVSVSSASHPFFTGSQQFVDSEGRINKFLKKYQKPAPKAPVEEKKEEKKAPAKKSKK
jgi:large subunit ribosomal protein L31